MRIALATSSFAPYVGGVEEHVRNVAHVLLARGHDVVVWTVEREGHFGIREVDGVPVWDLPAPLPARSLAAASRFAFRAPRASARWRSALREFRPEVVHVHCYGPNGTYSRAVAGRARVPLVISTHGETLADDEQLFTQSRFAIDSLRKGLRSAAAVTGCSRVALDDLERRFDLARGAGTVVFNGIDLDESIGPVPAGIGGRYIAAVGRVQRLKGFDLLIEAFARAQLPDDIRLVIGGGGPELDALGELSEGLGIRDRVVFAGWLDRGAVSAVRRGAFIGVVPSRLEPFGIGALEVWRAGSALVATTRGGPPEFVSDGVDGVLVDPEDVEEFAGVLHRLAQDPERTNEMGAAGARRVRDFTWERTVDAYESIYTHVVAASR